MQLHMDTASKRGSRSSVYLDLTWEEKADWFKSSIDSSGCELVIEEVPVHFLGITLDQANKPLHAKGVLLCDSCHIFPPSVAYL